jgi:uncharacterized membrane protein (TIGR02234 family)
VIDRLTSKRTVLLLVLVAASVVLISGSREWVSGSVDDAVLGASALHGKGSDVAPGALAAALVGMASAVAATTSGRMMRVVAACCALMAAVLGAAVVISVLLDANGALGRLAAAGTGRSGTVAAHGHLEGWAWAALAAMLVMGLGGVGALVAGRRWHGLSSRYEAGEPPSRPTSAPGSAWDQLSRGQDPTAGTDRQGKRAEGRS